MHSDLEAPEHTQTDRVNDPHASMKRLTWPDEGNERLTHQVFRYPAKFHPPIVRHLLREYTGQGSLVLDPFCGSGTSLVEAAALGRNAVGVDIDPLAVFVSAAKTTRAEPESFRKRAEGLLSELARQVRPASEYEALKFADIDAEELAARVAEEGLPVPALPRLGHWFRRYVTVDLGRILKSVLATRCLPSERRLLLLAFAASIRNSSNADPVPVSGLEVTAHMRKREAAGRLVNPYSVFERCLSNVLQGSASFYEACADTAQVSVFRGDARRERPSLRERCDLVVTSPPYYNAVDYYRRHLLEMYWLGLTRTEEDRLGILPGYIGRKTVRVSAPGAQARPPGPVAQGVVRQIAATSTESARSFRHYLNSMQRSLYTIAYALRPGGAALFVVGVNRWKGEKLPMIDIFRECASPRLTLREVHWYPLKNRYMSYARNHSADIAEEYVLHFCRTPEA